MSGGEGGAAGWRRLDERLLCETPWLRVVEARVATPSRPAGVIWTVAERPVAAVVVPRTPAGGYLMIRQERIPVGRELWEFPAGQVEGAADAETIRATALRELGEEAGVSCPGELVALGMFFSSAGFTTECAHLFLALDVVASPELKCPDSHEAIHEVRELSMDELTRAVADGTICDANSLAAYARLTARRLAE